MPLLTPSRDYANRLLGAAPTSDAPRYHNWLLLGMVLACILPRVAMATRIEHPCPDGVYYVTMAKTLAKGDVETYLDTIWLSPYPIALMLVHQLGLSWVSAGKVLGILAGSLTVLPLYGWMRRQFDTRVAIAGALVYALHPKFIEWSPELIRDQMFWLLTASTLYLSWRAATEIRWYWFLAAGISVTLGILTRFEAWFLLLPLLLWTAFRFVELPRWRWRLCTGMVLALAVYPLLLISLRTTYLSDYENFRWAQTYRLHWVVTWTKNALADAEEFWNGAKLPAAAPAPAANTALEPSTAGIELVSGESPVAAPTTPPASAALAATAIAESFVELTEEDRANIPLLFVVGEPERMSLAELTWSYWKSIAHGTNEILGLLMLIGLWKWRHVWARRDQQPIFLTCVLILLSVWIHFWYGQSTSSRYALSVALLGIAYSALGLMAVHEGIVRLASRLPLLSRNPQLAGVTLLVTLTVVQLVDALTSDDPIRGKLAQMATYIEERYGPQPVVLISPGMRGLTYYLNGEVAELPPGSDVDCADSALTHTRPSVMVLHPHFSDPQIFGPLVAHAEQMGLRRIELHEMPPVCRELNILLMAGPSPQAAQRSAALPPAPRK